MAPDISVIIVSYKVPALLGACLASLQREVADARTRSSSSTTRRATSRPSRRDEFPDVRLIALEENIGFAAGSNLGARAATGEYVLMLNPDTELVGDTLGALLR